MNGAGIRVLALALVGWSLFTLQRVAASGAFARGLAHHASPASPGSVGSRGSPGQLGPLPLAALALAALALLAAEALWSRRPRAFSLYAMWAIAAMGTFVLLRLQTGSAHLVRFMPAVLTLGLVFAGGALLLKRAV